MRQMYPLPTKRRHVPRDWSPEDGYPDDLVNEGLYRLGEAIYQGRRRYGWTQRMLASRSGVDQPTIARLERGVLPGIGLRRLARLLGCLDVLDLRPP
jgi:ribosome-binding protein aMBF1 (putative translation factor)